MKYIQWQRKQKERILIEKLDKVFSVYIRRRFAKNDIAQCNLLVAKKIIGKSFKTVTFNHENTMQLVGTNLTNVKFSVLVVMSLDMASNINFLKSLDLNYYDGLAEELHIESN